MYPLFIGAVLVAALFALSSQREALGNGSPPTPPPPPPPPPTPGTPPTPGVPPVVVAPPITATDCARVLTSLPEPVKAAIAAATAVGDKSALELIIQQLTLAGKLNEAICLRTLVGPVTSAPPATPPPPTTPPPPVAGVPKDVIPLECAQTIAALPEPYKSQLAIALAAPDAAERLETIALALSFFPSQAACVRMLIPKAKTATPGKLRAGCQDTAPGVWLYVVKPGDSPSAIAAKFFGPSAPVYRWGELINGNQWSYAGRTFAPGGPQDCYAKVGAKSVARYLGKVGVEGTMSYNFASLRECDVLVIPASWNPWMDELGVATAKPTPWPICG